MGLASGVKSIFKIDGRFRIGIGDGSASVLFRQRNNFRRGDLGTFNPALPVPRHLRDLMILTLEASEIATHSGHGERGRPRKEMKERLLFDGVHIQRDRTSIDEGVKLSLLILPHSTEAPFRERDRTSMVAEITLHLPIL
jgi:hypothetical protein